MKIAQILVLLLALAPALGQAQTAADYVAQGRAFLATHDLLNANKRFASAAALAPNNPDANVLLAATRLLTLANQPAGEAFLDRLGFTATNRSVYGWTARVPTDTNGVPFAPAGVSAAEIAAFLLTNCLPQIIAADASLAVVGDTNYTLALSSNETSTVSVTLDYGDLLLLRAGLNAAEYVCYTVCPWDFDVQLAELRAFWTNGASTAQEFLQQYPSLLTFTTTNDLQAARQAFSSAVALYTNASAFIRSRPFSTVRLFNYDPMSDQSEADFRSALIQVNDSLNGPVVLTWIDDYGTNLSIDMGNQFTEAFSPRAFFPQFSGKAIIAGTLPDPTFGGVVQGLASYQIEDFVGNKVHVPFVSRLSVPARVPGGQLQVRIDGLENSFYVVQVSTNLLDWSDLSFGVVRQGIMSFTDPAADEGPRRFYRALDRSGAVGVDLTVIDAQTGNPISAATVTLSVGWWEWNGSSNVWNIDLAVANSTDSAGHTISVLDPGSDWSYVVTVAASGYGGWSFDGYLPGDQHRTLSACLAVPDYRPPNNDFSQRQPLDGTNVTMIGFNVNATREQGAPYVGAGHTVWYTWTAPADGAVSIDTSASSFPMVLGAYTGNALTNLVPVGDGVFGSQADFFVQAGATYQIAVDSSWTTGRIVLSLRYVNPQAPVFTSRPDSVTAQVGQWIELSTRASGTAPLSYEWLRDGQGIQYTPGPAGGFYEVYGAQPSDAGSYTVVASNAAGSATGVVAVLTVIPTPPNDMFANATVITGTNSIVYGYDWSATSEPGEPSLGIGQSVWWTWTAPMDGAAVVDIGGSSGGQVLGVYTGNSVSHLTAVEELGTVADFFVHAGATYQMEVDSTGSGGRIVLRLYYTTPSAPVFDTQPASLSVGLSDSASFYAHASGTVPISYQWRKDGVDLVGQTDASLSISDVQTNQAGTYTVVASNAAGSVTSAPAVLTVLEPPPTFITQPLSTMNLAGESAYFSAQVSGGSPLTYQWQRNGVDILGATNWFYTINSVQTNDAGTYVLLAMNPAGTNASNPAVLTVLALDFAILHNFGGASDGSSPKGGLVQGSDGALYGTTSAGGNYGNGTVYKLKSDGSGYTILRNFPSGSDGFDPGAGLVHGSDGAFYGTTYAGGSQYGGTVFKLDSDGSGYTILHSFGNGSDGSGPLAGLVQGSDGAFYGTTLWGGTNAGWQGGDGIIFRLNSDGGGYTILHNFGNSSDVFGPQASLVQGSDGAFYGTTYEGGTYGNGAVFKVNADGSGYTNLHNFLGNGSDGSGPQASLVQGSDGALYGTTASGGSATGPWGNLYGTVFRLNPDGSGYTILHNFGNGSDGSNPGASLVQGTDGPFYGTTDQGGSFNFGTVFKLNSDGSGYTILHNFGNGTDGYWPEAGLVQGSDGAFYGTTGNGGSNHEGTVFRLSLGPLITAHGSLRVTIAPAGAVSAGAQWQVEGGTWQNSGATVSNLSVGNHTVSFSPILGWTTPSNQTVSIGTNSTTSVTGVYMVATPGVLTITLLPAAAVSAGAQWQVDGRPWRNSGATVTNLSAGGHAVSFSTIGGWTSPVNQTVTITSGVTITVVGVYTVATPGAAPASLSGLSALVTSRNDTAGFTTTFGATTYSQSTLPSTNQSNNVGNYTYVKQSGDTALLTLEATEPPDLKGTNEVALTFSSSTNATYITTNSDGSISTGAMVLSAAPDLAPASLTATLDALDSGGTSSTFVFANGTLNYTQPGITASATYTYTQYSPVGGLAVINFTSPALYAGTDLYLIVTWSSATAGSYAVETFPPGSTTSSFDRGTFTIP